MRTHAFPSRNRPNERGSVLLLALVIGTIIGIVMGSYMALVGSQNRAVIRSQAWNYEIAVAEAGLEEALTQLYYHPTDLSADGWVLATNSFMKSRALTNAYYTVLISNVMPPVVYSYGYTMIPGTTNYMKPRIVRIGTVSNALFRRGLVARGNIDMSGNNVMTDSFDSADPLLSTNGRYDPAKARDNGDVATNLGLVNSLSIGNAEIYGHAATGPGGSLSVGPTGGVGSRTWHNAGNNGVESGWFTDDMNVNFPDVNPPFNSGASVGSGSSGGTNYTYLIGSGNFIASGLSMSGQNKMAVTGNAVLYVTGDVSLSGQSFIYIAPGASLQLYVGGASTSISGNGVANANANSTNFFYYGLPSNTDVKLTGNAAFTGIIYAPQAAFTLGGGGNDLYDFVGASVTGSVKMNGHYNFHYDEALARLGASSGYVATSWNEL